MNSKNRSGFLLIEALFALFIAVLLLAPLFNSIGSLIQHVHSEKEHFERLLIAKNFLSNTLYLNAQKDEHETKKEQSVPDPKVALTYTEEKVSKKSSLARIQNLVQVRVNYRWELFFRGHTENLVLYQCTPPEKEEKK
jgi:type II secretory pathway component PulJ